MCTLQLNIESHKYRQKSAIWFLKINFLDIYVEHDGHNIVRSNPNMKRSMGIYVCIFINCTLNGKCRSFSIWNIL